MIVARFFAWLGALLSVISIVLAAHSPEGIHATKWTILAFCGGWAIVAETAGVWR